MDIPRLLIALLLGTLVAGCPGGTTDDDDDDSGGGADDDASDDDTSEADDDTSLPDDDASDDDAGDDDTAGYTGQPGTFNDSYAGRTYVLHVPDGYESHAPIPLVIGFHGAGDSASNFHAVASASGWTAAAAPHEFALLVPDTLSPYSDFAIWSGDPNNDMDEMVDEMDSVLELVGHIGDSYNIDMTRLHAFGFSDGGLFLAVAGLARFDRFATHLIAGYGWGSFYPMGQPPRRGPVMFVCGSTDSFYTYAQQSESYLASQGHPTRFDGINGAGHQFSSLMAQTTPTDIWAWIGGESL